MDIVALLMLGDRDNIC